LPHYSEKSLDPAGLRWHSLVGLRYRAIVAILIYTAARAGAVAKLKRGNFYHAGDPWMLHFEEKGGKSREIPVRHDLEKVIFEYLDAAGLPNTPKDTPLFRTAYLKTNRLTETGMTGFDVYRMVKRPDSVTAASLPSLIPHHDDYGSPRARRCPRGCPAPGRPR
jgi:integrase